MTKVIVSYGTHIASPGPIQGPIIPKYRVRRNFEHSCGITTHSQGVRETAWR